MRNAERVDKDGDDGDGRAAVRVPALRAGADAGEARGAAGACEPWACCTGGPRAVGSVLPEPCTFCGVPTRERGWQNTRGGSWQVPAHRACIQRQANACSPSTWPWSATWGQAGVRGENGERERASD